MLRVTDGERRRKVSCVGTVHVEFWNAASSTEWMTAMQITRASGRAKNGGSMYSSVMRSLVLLGAFEYREVQHINERGHRQGRPSKQYRRLGEMFYNTRQDARYQYKEWDELTPHDQAEARLRYQGQYPWLDWDDWLYPMTRGSKHGISSRLGTGATRVLDITSEQAEQKRESWRGRQAGWLMEKDGSATQGI